MMWGPGKTDFASRTVTVRGAECYPRPLQDRIPIMVGGQGPHRSLQLAARYADGVNLRGEPDVVAAAVGVLHEHCRREGRSPDAIEMSHLSWPLAAASRAEAGDLRRRHRRGDVATVAEHRGRLKALADLGITEFLFDPVDLADGPQAVERLEPLLTMG
jgi:alkanesulfonate monooxygenase SsuD/methylene tetrahydromethanopterin reductase-like flavin-dependent oxidoreductase (luciferase family)